NRNTVQMDLFPTNLIDNILVYKTFSPNLPGDFTCGYVDIATKDFPEQFTFNVSGSLGYNTLSTFNKDNYLTSPGSKTDWLGFDDGSRDIPEEVQNTTPFPEFAQGNSNPAIAQQIAGLTRSFNNNWEQYHESPFLNHSLSLSLGNQKELFG
ncbi:MAG: TonB-dependent receptor, partial [Saprospiraceae bacterium]|nr:TonB-dependent receptor [Saprospiraceae bacterium]